MANPADILLQSVHDYFLNLFHSNGAPGLATELCFEAGPTMVSPADFKLNPGDAAYSPPVAIEEVSRLSDTIPRVADGVFQRTTKSADTFVEMIIGGATASDASTTAAVGAAKTQVDQVYKNNQIGSLVGDYPYHAVIATPRDWYDPDDPANWASYTAHASDPPPPSPPPPPGGKTIPIPILRWHVLPEDLEPIRDPAVLAGVLAAPVAQVAPAAQGVEVQAAEVAGAPPIAMRVADLRLAPITPLAPISDVADVADVADVLNAPVAAAPVTNTSIAARVAETAPIRAALDPAVIGALRQRVIPPAEPPVGGVGEIANVRASLILASQLASNLTAGSAQQSVDAEDVSVSFNYCVVRLSRPWFPDVLLLTNGWYMPGYASHALSTGDLTDPNTIFPCVNTGFLAVKDLVITGTWSQGDSQAATTSSSLGPFSLLGALPIQNGDGSVSYSVSGIQIIAWICEPLPATPPDADPATVAP